MAEPVARDHRGTVIRKNRLVTCLWLPQGSSVSTALNGFSKRSRTTVCPSSFRAILEAMRRRDAAVVERHDPLRQKRGVVAAPMAMTAKEKEDEGKALIL